MMMMAANNQPKQDYRTYLTNAQNKYLNEIIGDKDKEVFRINGIEPTLVRLSILDHRLSKMFGNPVIATVGIDLLGRERSVEISESRPGSSVRLITWEAHSDRLQTNCWSDEYSPGTCSYWGTKQEYWCVSRGLSKQEKFVENIAKVLFSSDNRNNYIGHTITSTNDAPSKATQILA